MESHNFINLIPFSPLYTGNPITGTLVSSEDPDEMQHNAAFHQGLHCLLPLNRLSGTEIHFDLETSTCDPLKNKMGIHLLIVSIYMGKSIRIQRIRDSKPYDLIKEFQRLICKKIM